MPVNKTNPLSELKKAITYYAEKTGKRVTLEAALMKGVNTTKESAERLIDFAKGADVNVNLIPWNPVKTLDFEEPTQKEVRDFVNQLERAGLNVTYAPDEARKSAAPAVSLEKPAKIHTEAENRRLKQKIKLEDSDFMAYN